MIEVDGSEGGGQVVRTALSLSMVTGEPVELSGIRVDRPDPGLGHQHLTAVETAARVCDASVEGAGFGATDIAFDPGDPSGRSYVADIETAGSITLLFDTLLPVATRLDAPLTVRASGGTDVKWSPPMAFCRRVKLPLLRGSGLAVTVDERLSGFYPAGGGEATLRLWPSSPEPLTLDPADPTDLCAEVYSKASTGLASADVAERQAETAAEELDDRGIETTATEVTYAEATSPGSSVVVRLADERVVEGEGPVAGFDAYGEKGKPAEDVARDAVSGVSEFLASRAAVDTHLTDQLLVFLALTGGRVTIPRVTDHVETSLDVFESFGFDLSVDESNSTPVVEA